MLLRSALRNFTISKAIAGDLVFNMCASLCVCFYATTGATTSKQSDKFTLLFQPNTSERIFGDFKANYHLFVHITFFSNLWFSSNSPAD